MSASSSVSGYNPTSGQELTIIDRSLKTVSKCTLLAIANVCMTATLSKAGFVRIKAIFYPSSIRHNPADLKEALEKYMALLQENGLPTDTLHPERILESFCPNQEYNHQLMSYGNWQSPLAYTLATQSFAALYSGVAAPLLEEYTYRAGLQETFLKDGVREVIKRVSPAHANFVDSKIYTACRIVIASIAFASVHYFNASVMSNELVDDQVYCAFFMGLFFGTLKEVDGLSTCVYAHMINNLILQLGTFCMKC